MSNSEQIGYLCNGNVALCLSCGSILGATVPLFNVNIRPYQQRCACCDIGMFEPSPSGIKICELFDDKEWGNEAQRFFFDRAGYSWDGRIETQHQGRLRCAIRLAKAEQYAHNLGWSFRWSDDWDVGSHKNFYGSPAYDKEPETCENCELLDSDGKVLAGLGCIDDADAGYRRVIQADLAVEALHTYDREIETLDAH